MIFHKFLKICVNFLYSVVENNESLPENQNEIFWFRDYWANRQKKLHFRNSFSHIPETDTFRKFSSKLRRVTELMLNTDSNRCVLTSCDESSKYEVMNLMELKEKFEPWVLEMEEGSTDELALYHQFHN